MGTGVRAASLNLLLSTRSGHATVILFQENDDRATNTVVPSAGTEGERAACERKTTPQERTSAGHDAAGLAIENRTASGGALREEKNVRQLVTGATETAKGAPADTILGLGPEEGGQTPGSAGQRQPRKNLIVSQDGLAEEVNDLVVAQGQEDHADVTEGGRASDGRGREDRQEGQLDDNEGRTGPDRTPVSSCSSNEKGLPNGHKSDRPATSAPDATTGATKAEASTDPCIATREPGAVTRVTWCGQPTTLVNPVVVIVKDLCLRHRRLERGETGNRVNRRRGDGDDVNRGKRDRGTTGFTTTGDSGNNDTSSSDERSNTMLAAQGKGRSASSAYRAFAKGRDGGKTRGATKSGGGRCGEEKCIGEGKDQDGEEAADEGNINDSAKQHGNPGSPSPRGGQGRSSAPRSASRPAFFLLEPYVGPPIATCSRAWPAGTSVAVDTTKGYRQRASHVSDKKSSCESSRRKTQRKHLGAGRSIKGRLPDGTGIDSGDSSGDVTSEDGSCRTRREAFPSEEKRGEGTLVESKDCR